MNKLHKSVHKHLKLRHHKHTGKLLHHKHTSYRGLAVVLVLAGIVIAGATVVQRAAADTLFGVYATVQGPVPTIGAVISTPSADALLTSSDTLVAGSCPVISPQVAIMLTVDGSMVGSAICDASNDFAIPIVLSPGAHTLIAHTYTVTLGRGPDSQPLTVTCQPLHPTAQPANPNLAPTLPLATIGGDRTATWNGSVTGGTAPYGVTVDWGDGTREHYTATTADQRFSHHYTSVRSHNAVFAVTDANGHSTQQQYATVAYTNLSSSSTAVASSSHTTTPTAMAGLYGLFLTTVSVAGIVWLESKHAARQEAAPVRIYK